MKRTLIFLLASCSVALAQSSGDVVFAAPVQAGAIAFGTVGGPGAVVKGAPYSATLTNESVQTLSDGTHITQSSSGSAARDSQGRSRQDTPLPSLGGLAPEDAPHLVLIQDPVAGISYTLNLTDKTAWKHAIPPGGPAIATTAVSTATVVVRTADDGELPPPPPPPGAQLMFHKRMAEAAASGDTTTENLGTQIIEGVQATGVRTTQTIAAGKIGNDRPISIVTEVWTSSELKTVVLSKRSDPRMGEQTFKLTNIQRSEPDPSLFTVPTDFKLTDNGAETFIYRTKHQP
jgi:hypothetical protein